MIKHIQGLDPENCHARIELPFCSLAAGSIGMLLAYAVCVNPSCHPIFMRQFHQR